MKKALLERRGQSSGQSVEAKKQPERNFFWGRLFEKGYPPGPFPNFFVLFGPAVYSWSSRARRLGTI